MRSNIKNSKITDEQFFKSKPKGLESCKYEGFRSFAQFIAASVAERSVEEPDDRENGIALSNSLY